MRERSFEIPSLEEIRRVFGGDDPAADAGGDGRSGDDGPDDDGGNDND